MVLALETKTQIDALEIDGGRPLFICDVDEVVVHFIRGLEEYLQENRLGLFPDSFALNGNIRRLDDQQPISVDDLRFHLDAFFRIRTRTLEVIEGAVEGLAELSHHAQIIMLTNLPGQYRDDRIANLKDHGLDFPVVVNQGKKGPAIKALAATTAAPLVFIDDSPDYLKSASDHHAAAHLIHFMQDARFGRHIGRLDYASLQTANWDDVFAFSAKVFESHANRN